jgi:hypothetical protein
MLNCTSRGLYLALAVGLLKMSAPPSSAHAQGSSDLEESGHAADGCTAQAAAAHECAQSEVHEGERAEEPAWTLGIDAVLGFGKTNISASGTELTSARVTSESFVLGAAYEPFSPFEVALRIPLAFATLSPAGTTSRSAFAFGNPEIEAEYAFTLAPNAKLSFALGIALPLAQGSEVPIGEAAEREPVSGSRKELDRGAALTAAASARGFEDEALFEVDRFGIVPKARFDYRYGRLLVRPYVTLETLIHTGNHVHDALVELLIGTYLGARVTSWLDLGARVWTDLALAGGGETVSVLEPQVGAHFAATHLTLGGIWPFAGHLSDLPFGAVRAMVTVDL